MRRGLIGVLTIVATFAFPGEPLRSSAPQGCCDRQVILVLMDDLSFDDAVGIGWPMTHLGGMGIGLRTAAEDREVWGRAAYEAIGRGGAYRGALREALVRAGLQVAQLTPARLAPLVRSEEEVVSNDNPLGSASMVIASGRAGALHAYSFITASRAVEFLFIAAGSVPARATRTSSDEAPPIVISRGRTDSFNPREGTVCPVFAGCARGLTSDTTRREGIVSNVDVAPTILHFLGVPIPEEMTGSPIRIEGEPPTTLHRRYLQYQRIHIPVGLLALTVALLTLFTSVGVLLFRRGIGRPLLNALAMLALFSVALPVVMLPASLLPRLTYPFVLPTLAIAAALVMVVALQWRRGDATTPVVLIAGLGMGVVILDGILGWPAMLTPLLGDSALEGVRFYGMGNAYAGVYMAGAILIAPRIPPVAGMALLAAAGLLAGLPNFGAELGTGFTLFAAAGLWYMFRVRQRFGLRELAIAGAVALAGLAFILLIHRFSSVPTHITRVVEEAERSGAGGILDVFGRRLALNIRNTSAIPPNWLVVAILPVWLAVAWRRSGPFGSMLRRDPAWRDATVVLALSSMIGFLVNDSMGVAGMGFTFLSAALIYPALRERWTISG